jgi:glycosyltransferase involved in cell wall biosynthesis
MRVLVYPHDLDMGGSQTNAIELAAQIRELGAEAMVFGRPGTLNKRIAELGLEFIESPDPGRRPSLRIAATLRALARERQIDILHGYEWPPALECSAASSGLRRTRAVSTVMSMAAPPFIPTTTPLVVGTEQIAAAARATGRSRVDVIEPPVDLEHNLARSPAEVAEFRRAWGLAADRPLLVCVTRLANQLKAEGLYSAMTAVSGPLAELRVQLLIVGDGPARREIGSAAARANALAPGSVTMTGELLDPRVAYSAADVVLGMGGSALRALAFTKPLVVQGEGGFFRVLDEHSWPDFAWQGWYGVGGNAAQGAANLTAVLRPLLADPLLGDRLGRYGRGLVEDHFSLTRAAERQLQLYRAALEDPPGVVGYGLGMARAGQRFTTYYAGRKLRRWTGRGATDDFNARPVAAAGPARGEPELAAPAPPGPALVYLAGAPWHAVAGTDVQLATAIGRRRPVVWVDPPVSIVSRLRRRIDVPLVSQVAPGVTRIHPTAPPGVTRPVVRTVSIWWAYALVRVHLHRSGQPVSAVLTSSPEALLTQWRSADVQRIYFATDDFVAGARLLGMSAGHVQRARDLNLAAADTVLAVSAVLAGSLAGPNRAPVTFPNGCDLRRYADPGVHPSPELELADPVVGVVGQLNERLDLDHLEAVADAGLSLVLIGPRYEQTPEFAERLSRLLGRPNVQWIGRRSPDELPGLMAGLQVGLTPYADTAFNRASFPLKTLEYLAAGVPVVSTPLPATRALDPGVVRSAALPAEFVAAVRATLADRDVLTAGRCREQAAAYSWDARAAQLEDLLAARSGAS